MKRLYHALRRLWLATPEWKRSVLITALLLLALTASLDRMPAFRRCAFVMPTAWIAAWFLSAERVPTPEGCLLVTSAAPVHVILACSGAGFFALLASLLLGQLLAARRPTIGGLALMPAAAYAMAVAANSARVVFAWFAVRWIGRALPSYLVPAVKTGAECLVFIVFLAGTWVLFAHVFDKQRKENRP